MNQLSEKQGRSWGALFTHLSPRAPVDTGGSLAALPPPPRPPSRPGAQQCPPWRQPRQRGVSHARRPQSEPDGPSPPAPWIRRGHGAATTSPAPLTAGRECGVRAPSRAGKGEGASPRPLPNGKVKGQARRFAPGNPRPPLCRRPAAKRSFRGSPSASHSHPAAGEPDHVRLQNWTPKYKNKIPAAAAPS